MAKRIWFILGGLWFVIVGGYLFLHDYTMTRTVVAVACGYPDVHAKGYADCVAMFLPKANAAMWHWLLTNHLIWIVAPALALAATGVLVRKRA